jgi:hypothetical protein
MTVARKVSFLLMTYVCAFILAYLMPEQIDRQDYARAVVAYTQNPTQENEAALRNQRQVNERIHLMNSAALSAVPVAVGFGIWSGRRLMTRLTHQAGPRDLRQ